MLDGVVPFPAEFAAAYRAKGYWQDVPLGQVFEETFRRHSDRVAIVAGEQRITYAELNERAERLALHLLDLGLRPLSRVVIHLPNIPEFVYLYFALQKIGAIPLMALPPHRQHEISHYVDFIDAELYVVPDRWGNFDFVEFAAGIKAGAKTVRHVLVAGDPGSSGFLSIGDLLNRPPSRSVDALRELRIDPTDPCCFQLSGGTTGIPKVIPRSHNDYVYNSRAIGQFNDIRPDDALLVVLPIAHNFPLASPGIQAFFLEGARAVLSTSVRPADVLSLMERERVTHVELAPAIVIRWLDEPGLAERDLSSLRVINTGGQKFQPEIKRRAEELIPSATVQEVFGMAEGLLTITRLDDSEEVRMETIGRPVCPDDEVKLVDDDGKEVPAGELGEMICRGPYTLRGYYRLPDHNARVFTPDGFYKSGDVMRLHPSGNYVVEGRKKDLINRGGEKISAEEVEDMILSHPAIHNVACVPMPDRVLGEKMCAFAILHPNSELSLPELTAFLNEKGLARFKHPERLETVADFPLSNFGKVQKHLLTARITEILAAEAG